MDNEPTPQPSPIPQDEFSKELAALQPESSSGVVKKGQEFKAKFVVGFSLGIMTVAMIWAASHSDEISLWTAQRMYTAEHTPNPQLTLQAEVKKQFATIDAATAHAAITSTDTVTPPPTELPPTLTPEPKHMFEIGGIDLTRNFTLTLPGRAGFLGRVHAATHNREFPQEWESLFSNWMTTPEDKDVIGVMNGTGKRTAAFLHSGIFVTTGEEFPGEAIRQMDDSRIGEIITMELDGKMVSLRVREVTVVTTDVMDTAIGIPGDPQQPIRLDIAKLTDKYTGQTPAGLLDTEGVDFVVCGEKDSVNLEDTRTIVSTELVK